MDKTAYVVILAGGKGERLWPLSRELLPKQLIPFRESTLLEQTIERFTAHIPKERRSIVTTEKIKNSITAISEKHIGMVLSEPALRNTGPAILLSCLEIAEQDPNALLIFVSADHAIPDNDTYIKQLTTAADAAKKTGSIVLLGLKPIFPATGYGYIEFDATGTDQAKKIIKFHEKPTVEKAQEYCTKETLLWNTGQFCGTIPAFIQAYKTYAPEIYAAVCDYRKGTLPYEMIPSCSIDYAIMEKSSNLYVLPCSFAWSDVGNLKEFLTLAASSSQRHPLFTINSNNNLVSTKKPIALLGVDNLCIVETDDMLFVGSQDKIEDVKLLVKKIDQEGFKKFL